MPITNRVEEKKCYGKQNTYYESDCLEECCQIMRDECYLQTIENVGDKEAKKLYGGTC